MKPAIHARAPIALAASVFAFLVGCREAENIDRQEARPALAVDLVSPGREQWPEDLVVSGRIKAWQESVVSSEINGYKLDQVLVNVGDTVTKGQVLASFNEASIRTRLAEMEADVKTREAAVGISRDQLERSSRLAGTGAVSAASHKQNESALQRDEAELASARARLSAQQLELHYTRVVAPDDGVISSRTATVGTVLSSGSELFCLIRQGRLEWRAEIPSKDLARVEPGQPAVIQSEDGTAIRGIVRQLGATIDPRTLNGVCYVDLPEPALLKAGMYLGGSIRIGQAPALHLPESAIIYRDGCTYLMRVGNDCIARQLKVVTARRRENCVEVNGEISEADRFIRSGGSFVSEGDLVKVVTAGAVAGVEGGEP